jgi:peptide/nickel transport system permease protein
VKTQEPVDVMRKTSLASALLPSRPKMNKNWRRVFIIGALLICVVLVAVLAPVLMPQDPFKVSIRDRLKPPGYTAEDGRLFILGTDAIGRDMLSRIILGSQMSLLISFSAVSIAAVIGSIVGLAAGFLRGKFETVVMRIADIWLAFPEILLALSVTAALGPNVINLIVALGLSRWVSYVRLVRGNVLSLREQEFVTAARAVGVPSFRIIFRHILPNVLDVIVILAALHLGQMIILESALSFLGLGIQPPTPSWGGMIGDGRVYLDNAWWVATFPGLAIAVTVLLAGLFGDAMRDALDPRFRED